MNTCTWTPAEVRLHDLRMVPDNSPEWMAECEARYYLRKPDNELSAALELIGQRRGAAGRAKLEAMLDVVRPAYILDLPNKPQRQAYLGRYELRAGAPAAERLRERILALHYQREGLKASCAGNAA